MLSPRTAKRAVMRTVEMTIAKVIIWIRVEKGIGIIIKWIVIIGSGIGLNL
jgi:hypothetical protein